MTKKLIVKEGKIMIKKKLLVVLTLSLFIISYGCSSDKEKTIKVENFDYGKMKEVELVKRDGKVQKTDDKYKIHNKYFEYANELTCSQYQILDDNNSEAKFFQELNKTDLTIYKANTGKCQKIHTFQNVGALSIEGKEFNEVVYINVIINDDNEQSGLWSVSDLGPRHLSYFFSMASDIEIDKENEAIYTIEHSSDVSFFRKYTLTGQMVEEHKLGENSPYHKFYLDGTKIKFIYYNEIEEGMIYEYMVDSYDIETVFEDIDKPAKETVKLTGLEWPYNTFEKSDKYVAFHGVETTVCTINFSECFKYDSAMLVGNSDYLLVGHNQQNSDYVFFNLLQLQPLDSSAAFLTKLGSYDADKLLNSYSFYWKQLVGDKLIIKMANEKDDESVVIEYTLNE